MRKRTNPRRIPCTQADVDKAAKRATDTAIRHAQAIIFAGLLDGGYIKPWDMKAAWEAVGRKAESVSAGYCTIADIAKTLDEEYDIVI